MVLYDLDEREPKTPTEVVTYTPVPGGRLVDRMLRSLTGFRITAAIWACEGLARGLVLLRIPIGRDA